ncbi:MAG: Glycosyltransferase [Parcubacteria group bacterium GW2011_GWA2_51_12]|nr:MAG: Glycosyltransferase [Parcubacteria group bacterium GW2011_GWA2_51_12]
MAQFNYKISNGVKPRILIFSLAYEPWIGGAELAVRYTTDRLFNYEFDLITCQLKSGPPKKEKVGNVNVYRVGFGGRLGKYLYPFFAARLANKLHRRAPYAVAWSIMAAYAGAATMLFLRRQPGVKFLLTLQEGDPIEHIHSRVRYVQGQWRKIFSRADHIQAISNFLAEWAKKEGAKCPIEVIPNGVDLDKFSAKGGSPPSPGYGRAGASGGKFQKSDIKNANQNFKITTASRLVHKNGIDILVLAAARLKSMIPGSKFVIQILGAGPEEAKLKRLARDIGVTSSVEFVGHVAPDDLPKYYADADVFVRPSRSEGLGSAFLEAMAAGLPVVGTPVGGIPDFLKEGETGLFCRSEDPADLAQKLAGLMQNDDLRSKLARNGRKLVESEYAWERIAGQMDKLLNRLA